MKYEDQVICTNYKFGILYCKDGQGGEREMYNNGTHDSLPPPNSPNNLFVNWISSETGSEAFEEFLGTLADKVRLEGYSGYSGGLDTAGRLFPHPLSQLPC